MIRKKITNHMEANDLICSHQHSFWSGRSYLTQLLHHFDDVLEALTNNMDFDSIFLDYAKAFDKVDHKILLKKLHLYGIHHRLIRWIEYFLSNRMQGVVVNGKISLLAIILSDVPQGTDLGPISFLIFINDITLCISNSILSVVLLIISRENMYLDYRTTLIMSSSGLIATTWLSTRINSSTCPTSITGHISS